MRATPRDGLIGAIEADPKDSLETLRLVGDCCLLLLWTGS